MADPEIRFYRGITYYADEPKWVYHPHDMPFAGRQLPAVDLWCIEQFGPPNPKTTWYRGGHAFWFRREDDAIAFRLRWC